MGEKRKTIIGRMMMYFLIIAFFACVLFFYYTKLFSETRENIINKGRTNAVESTDRIDKSLAASMDIIYLSAYTLDNMLKANRSNEDILDYLENLRPVVKAEIDDPGLRHRILKKAADICFNEKRTLSDEEIEELIKNERA